MVDYKEGFIDFLLDNAALKIGGDFTLKSKRISPWFVNVGEFNRARSTRALGEFYASALRGSGIEFGILCGIPEKGVGLAIATASAFSQDRPDLPWFFWRKMAKEHGEASSLTLAERRKAMIVGRAPNDGDAIAQLDDVFTAGDAKYEARQTLETLGNFTYPVLAIAVDRQEVGIDGKSAIEEYEARTGTKVVSVLSASDIYNNLRRYGGELLSKVREELVGLGREISGLEERLAKTPDDEGLKREIAERRAHREVLDNREKSLRPESLDRLAKYLRVYGTKAARDTVVEILPDQRIIPDDRSVIPACDVAFEDFENLVQQTANVEGIGGYKLPARAGRKGWETWVRTARQYTDKPLIHDGQKWGADIPDTGKEIMKDLKESGFDAVIIFPESGPETERAWIYHAFDQGLKVIVGGRMTHPGYAVSEGGWITDEGAMKMYEIAARAGVSNFVVPGNKLEVIRAVRELVEAEGVRPVFYAPGFIAQGGVISDAAKVAGDRFHGIVGRGIYAAQDMHAAAAEHTSQLRQ
jgi:orotidine-5'-phosphate decarboxylase